MKDVKLTKIQAQCLAMAAELASKSNLLKKLGLSQEEEDAFAEALVKLKQAFKDTKRKEDVETNE